MGEDGKPDPRQEGTQGNNTVTHSEPYTQSVNTTRLSPKASSLKP